MLTLCPECNLHYEDVSQSSKCNGTGRSGNHGPTGLMPPIREHIKATRDANASSAARANPDGPRTARNRPS